MLNFLIASAVFSFFVILAIVLIYNGLVNKRNQVDYAFSSIDVQLKKRFELVPNLVATVKAYAAHEKELLENVTATRNQLAKQQEAGNRFNNEEALGGHLSRLIAVAEDYPDLKADKHFLNLQWNLTEIESQISAARRTYNASVMNLNNAVDMFPSSLVAKYFNVIRRPSFEVLASERVAVKV